MIIKRYFVVYNGRVQLNHTSVHSVGWSTRSYPLTVKRCRALGIPLMVLDYPQNSNGQIMVRQRLKNKEIHYG